MPRKTLKLITTPDDDRSVFIAGSFNDWQIADTKYRMMPGDVAGTFEYTFDFPDYLTHVEYKYARGGWECVELGPYGESTDNHRREMDEDWSSPDRVANWANAGLHYSEDLLPQIVVINEAFEIPEAIRTRRVAALLPHDYYETDKHYPVLYLQDGQNLFDDNAPYGSWGVDKQLASMTGRGQGDFIVVAIDHAQDKRVSEFTPSFKTELGRGDGQEYCRFLAETLKPYIDGHFRTLPEARHTGIGGSSLGGLISVYAGILYPHIYDLLMVFSPSLWVAPNLPNQLKDFTWKFKGKIYLYGGEAESSTMVSNMHRLKEGIEKQAGADQVKFRLEVDPHGQHNEARWGKEFPKAIAWLFYDE